MSENSVNLSVSGGTPGADANDYTLFDSTVACGAKHLQWTGWKRITLALKNSGSGTLKASRSTDGGTNWDEYDSQAVAAAGAGVVNGPYDYDIAPYLDWKLVWTNGGAAQTTWRPELAAHHDRVSAL
jgi:hypothetical protein